ncbi:MAG: ABC transporter ATP-binding protein [Lachnospiraceae bacterium]|nr:ABC transporter ATP-binding protein [Robinsoniella sp.]MDY3766227.1 ABC transporter ATP-binding protein [Lachnospiraceae bacterium]
MSNEKNTLLEVNNLHTSFHTSEGVVQSVRGITFHVDRGESLGIVGESGCGKSVTMLSIMRLLDDNAKLEADSILFDGEDLSKKTKKEMRPIQGNRIGMIFQDPMTSLNPLFTVGEQIKNPLKRHQNLSGKKAEEKAIQMLERVGIPDPAKRIHQYPHELSGGMRQRVMIAIAMCCEPELLIADEPTTALDVTIQAQILDLMKNLKEEYHSSIILITHDLGVIAGVCSRIVVMYGGLIMEEGTTEDIFYRTAHPYTAGLLSSIPKEETKQKLIPIPGTPPDLLNPPKGCPFAARCKHARKLCKEQAPGFIQLSEEHRAACWLLHPAVKQKLGEVKIR